MTRDEALAMALDYLERHAIIDGIPVRNAIREILAEPDHFAGVGKMVSEQEPVAWMTQASNFVMLDEFTKSEAELYGWTPLYTSPSKREYESEHDLKDVRCGCCGYMTYHREHMGCIRSSPPKREWVGLTEEEIRAMDAGLNSNASFYAGALWAEAKLKEKNT
jgi:hypothetical protein